MADALQTDIAVVGGGLAGGLAAAALSARGFSVALIDAQSTDDLLADAYDGRTTAVAYACARVFERLGLWDDIAASAGPIDEILVTDGDAGGVSPFRLHFDGRAEDPARTPGPLGYIVENPVLRRAIYRSVVDNASIDLRAPARAVETRFDNPHATIQLDDGSRIAARLVLAADGRRSPLRAAAGINAVNKRYAQTAIIATVRAERPHNGLAQELFLPSGPFAILPMTDNRLSIVWTERAERAPAYLALDDAAFLAEIQARAGDYLGALSLAGPRGSYPLGLTIAQRFAAPRLALIGDAARAIHPIAGQGFNLGVKDAAALADVLDDARRVGLDIGDLGVLQRYERWRRFDSLALALGTDAFNHLFSNDIAPVRLARRIGLGAVNAARPLRQFFMREAGGEIGTLPSLMQT